MSSVNGTGGTASNEDLLREVERLKRQLGELSNLDGSGGVEHAALEKSGYLFKWQDRSIGWGGTKWGLRFVRLEHGQLSYYKSHEEKSPRYVLTLKNCAVRDEGSKANPRHNRRASNRSAPEPAKCAGTSTPETYHEEGSHFHVFSVYHLHVKGGSRRGLKEEEDDIIPLLRFSTQSLAEKSQWLELISQACAYCDSPEFVAAQQQQHQRTTQQHQHPSRDRRGKLPKLIFETPQPPLPRLPSGHVGLNKMAQSFRSRTAAKDAARSNKISYPPSKPMHRQASPSYLSPEGRDQDYRGLFNLLLIILLVSNVRLMLDTVAKHGFIWDELVALKGFYEAPLNDFPFVSGLLTVQAFVMGAYLIEKLLSKGWISNQFGMLFHFINTNASLGVVMAIVWRLIDHPVVGALLIMQATITWLKLISYAHANYDYRATSLDKHQATLALVKDLDKKGMALSYPENVTLKDIYYFWLAPTLTYQMAFPRTPFVRWTRVVAYALHLFASATLMAFLAAQVIAPSLDNLVKHLETHGGEVQVHVIGNYLLNLSLTSTYIWLLMFYAFFHCFMNLTAELLRFGDRVFYRDWWNASEVSAYWRLWNMPVHYWLVRHVYFPSVRVGLSKTGATFVVFLFSAVLHEVLISVPCHMIRAHSFLAMMGQLPLIFLTKKITRRFPGSSIGNIIFWISFCFIGQPMAMLLYTIDYWEIHLHGEQELNIISKFKIAFAAIRNFVGASPEL